MIKYSNRRIITIGHLKVDLLKDNDIFPGIFEDDEDAYDSAEEVAPTNNRKVRSVGNDNSEVELVETKETAGDTNSATELYSNGETEKMPHIFKTKIHSATQVKPPVASQNDENDAKLPIQEVLTATMEGNKRDILNKINY